MNMARNNKNKATPRPGMAALGAAVGHLQLNPDDFILSTPEEKQAFVPQHRSISYWKDAWRRLRRNYVAMVSLGLIVFFMIFAYIGPVIVNYNYDEQVRGSENLAPFGWSQEELARKASGESIFPHVFGTDNLGRDTLVRLMFGCRVSMVIGLAAAFLTLIIGVIYGSIAGFFGGRLDMVMMRIVDVIYSLPDVLVVLILAVTIKPILTNYADAHQTAIMGRLVIALGPSILGIFVAFALLYWTTLARIIRGQVLQLKQQEYVTAARALGASNRRIIMKHILPNCVGPLVAATCLQIPIAIFLESFLSFLGVGVNAPMTSLGSMASDALKGMYTYTYRLIIPASFLSLMILSFNIFGDGLRDALDPHLKK